MTIRKYHMEIFDYSMKSKGTVICDVLQYCTRGGFEGNSHGGQWTTEGSLEPCVIVEVYDGTVARELDIAKQVKLYGMDFVKLTRIY